MILYLHGFRSSPDSFKARLLAAELRARGDASQWLCPQLPASPANAIESALALTKRIDTSALTIIGSSLGGFYATYLAESLGCRAVLLNPAICPSRDLATMLGSEGVFRASMYHSGEPFEFRHAYLAELDALAVARITKPRRYFLIAAKGDEVLDWREMVGHYPRTRKKVLPGSDHGISDFARYLPEVLKFAYGEL